MLRSISRTCGRGAALCCLAAQLALAGHADEGPHAHGHEHAEHDAAEEIVITASPLVHDRDELAGSVETLDRRQILEGAGTTLGETLAGLPGVTTSGFAAGASRPVIRGQDAFRTGVVEDGLGTGDVSTLSPDHGVPSNPLVAKRIEVVRGPATLRYGGGAIAGVVNTLTGRVPRSLPDAPVTGDVFGAFGHNADERQLAFQLEGAAGPLAWHADAMSQHANDYDLPDAGSQSGSSVDARSFSGGAAYVHERGRLGFAYSRFENEYGIPEPGEEVRIELESGRYRLEGDLEQPLPGIHAVRARLAVTDYEHAELAAGVVGQRFDNEEVEARVEVLHAPLAHLSGAAGVHVRHRDESFGGEAEDFLAPAETLSVAGYLFEELSPLPHLDVQLGLRVEGTRVEGTPLAAPDERERDFLPLSASLALLFHPNDWLSLGLTGSLAERAPSASELFARGPHEATGTFERGDPDLDEETSYTGELVVRVERDGLRGEVSHFVTRYDDYVSAELLGFTVDEQGDPDPAGELDALAYRARGAFFYGGEVSLEAELLALCGGQLGVDAQLDWVRARGSARRRNLPRITPIRFGAGVFFERDDFRARVGFLRHERVDRTGFGESETDAFTLLEVDLRYRLALFDERASVELFASGRNLANENARNHVSFNKDEVRAPAARARVGIRGAF